MRLSTIGRAAAVLLTVGCGAGGPGTIDVSDDPAGPFSGSGSPGPFAGNRRGDPAFRLGTPGPFSGSGSPRVGAQPVGSVSALCSALCARQVTVCAPGTGGSCQQQCSELNGVSECERNLYIPFLTCLLGVDFTCDEDGIVQDDCRPPNVAPCRGGTTPPTNDGGSNRDAR